MLERVWRRGNPLTLLVGMQTSKPLWRTVWRFLKKLEVELPDDPAILLLGIHSESESEVVQLCQTLCGSMDCSLPGSSEHGIFPGKSTGVGCHFLLQGIFPTHGLNPVLLHCRQTLYPLSHQGIPQGNQNWKRHVYPYVHRSTVYNSQDMEAT